MKKLLSVAAAAFILCISASAQQNLRSSYFMDTYAYSYRFNPSFIPRNDHVSIGIGNVEVGAESNIPGNAIFNYVEDGGYYDNLFNGGTSMPGELKDINRINANAYVDLFSLGFHKGNYFHSIDLGVKANASLRAPGDLYDTMQSDFENDHAEYHLKDFAFDAGGNIELAYGLATTIADRINVGGRVKLQFGAARARGQFNSIDVYVNDNIVDARTDGFVEFDLPSYLAFPEKNGEIDRDAEVEDVFTVGDVLTNPAGLGVAFDLGASMKVTKDLTVSFAVNDLGFMKWGISQRVEPGDFVVNTDESGSDENDSDFEKVVDNMPLTLVDHSSVSPFSATFVAGIEYAIPGAKGLSVGLVGTGHAAKIRSWSEGRLVMNYVAPKVLEVAVSGAISSFGPGAGFVMSLDLGPFNVFAGVDSFLPLCTMDKYGVPSSTLYTSAALGVSIIWGRNKNL